jgi:hypothetical protein
MFSRSEGFVSVSVIFKHSITTAFRRDFTEPDYLANTSRFNMTMRVEKVWRMFSFVFNQIPHIVCNIYCKLCGLTKQFTKNAIFFYMRQIC